MKNSEILINARKLIEKPENWIKLVLARDSTGFGISPLSKKAVCFCSVGAAAKASDRYTNFYNNEIVELLNQATIQCTVYLHHSVWLFNDHKDTKHEDVLRVFDKAIELAKEQEQ